MSYLGRWEVDDVLTFPANTHATTGAATDADSVPSYRVYEDETGTAILTGSMAKLDDANTVGFYSEQITLSAANGFEVGKSYTIYISATVSSVVGTMSYTFQVEAALATASALATVQSDTDDIQSRLPAALVSGRIDASAGALAANVITTTSIANDAITDAKVASDVTIASVTGAVGSVTSGVTVTTNNDKTGYSLSAAAIQAIWDALTSALTTVGSIGKLLVDNVNATISSRLASASYTTPPTVGAIADQVWEEAIADHSGTVGSTAEALNAAGAAGDPWTTALPGAYGAGSAGNILGNNLNTTVSSRATQTSVDTIDDFLDTEIAAIKAKTDGLPADPADASDIAASFTTVNTKLDTIDDLLDTEVAALTSDVAAILDDTGNTGVVVASASKSGYALSATGLDSISVTAPSGVATIFPQMVVQLWRRFFKKTTLDVDLNEIVTYADDGTTPVTTQVVSDDGTIQTVGAAT